MQSGLFHRLGEYSNVGRESEKAKQPSFGICGIRSIWLQVPSFPRARPRMYRREVWVAALNLIEAHSHTLDMQLLDGSNFRAHPPSHGSGAWLSARVHRLANLIMAGSHFAGGQGNTKARSCRRVGAGNFHTLL